MRKIAAEDSNPLPRVFFSSRAGRSNAPPQSLSSPDTPDALDES
jgi:hypothetical protein